MIMMEHDAKKSLVSTTTTTTSPLTPTRQKTKQQQQQQQQQGNSVLLYSPTTMNTMNNNIITSLNPRRPSDTYDVTSTMNRLRTSFIGEPATTTVTTYTTASSSSVDDSKVNRRHPIWNSKINTSSDYGSTISDESMDITAASPLYTIAVTHSTSIDDDEVENGYPKRPPLMNDIASESTPLNNNGKEAKNPLTPKRYIADSHQHPIQQKLKHHHHHQPHKKASIYRTIRKIMYQIPAIVLVGMFHLMVGIPFGVSYFPIGWRNDHTSINVNNNETTITTTSVDEGGGIFPLPGKEALGIRMFLLSTIIGQIVFTYTSGFTNPIGLQMVENVPFCHELSRIAISYQGYGLNTLSTIFIMFGISSIAVGIVFYLLGKFKLGRVVYYFPKHVLVGCIGGIGVYIAKTGVEVTMNDSFSINSIIQYWNLLLVVIIFELILRILEKVTRDSTGKAKYPLLSPIYFCSITPLFYVLLFLCQIPIQKAKDDGYFFPDINNNDSTDTSSSSSFFGNDVFALWTIIDFPTVSIPALVESIPTMIALILFSLIHVPINIPAFAISSGCTDEIDMNQELISHGYSNFIAAFAGAGGLQNYMAYTQSVVYYKSGGNGKVSGIAVAVLTSILFVIGPKVASYIPRCMAGCLLAHVGIDLFLEGVYDSYGQFDLLEYTGVWLIVIVMTLWGMEASMFAGFIAALSTYAVQTTSYVDPIRGYMSGTTLRSSHFQRSPIALDILASTTTGRSRILVLQLQGHLFFGNIAHFTDSISDIVSKSCTGTTAEPIIENNQDTLIMVPVPMKLLPLILIIDFSLVLGIDSSAAQSISRIRNVLRKKYNINLCIFVTGSVDGFPTYYDLTADLSMPNEDNDSSSNNNATANNAIQKSREMTGLLNPPKVPVLNKYSGSYVFSSLDEGLVFAENALIAFAHVHEQIDATSHQTPIEDDSVQFDDRLVGHHNDRELTLDEERIVLLQNLIRLAPQGTNLELIRQLASLFVRDETYANGHFIWKQGSTSDCTKLLIRGQLMALLEDEAGTCELISHGNLLGELGLIQGITRMSSVQVMSDVAICYTLYRSSYDDIVLNNNPNIVRIIDLICVRYLAARVQHVSNRIFETRCLPV